MFKKMREPVNGLTHYFGAVLALIGLIVLLSLSRDDLDKQRTMLIYGTTLVLMLLSSASYHLLHGSAKSIGLLRKIDHATIYILIAGTYTPICFNQFTGFWRWGMLAIIWGIAVIGVLIKMLVVDAPRWLSAVIYLAMGWLSMLAIGEMIHTLPFGALAWITAGGLVYTLGAIIYITKVFDFKPGVFGFHEVWHIFVILGCICHYVAISVYIAPIPS